jgi:membrane protease subunit (stomatin/prohibitin family)
MTGWFHTNRIGLSPAAMAGMQLGVQMLASFNGAVRMQTTTQGQTLCSRMQLQAG